MRTLLQMLRSRNGTDRPFAAVRRFCLQLEGLRTRPAQAVIGKGQLLDHRRRAERDVVAVADVHRAAGERLARRGAADRGAGLDDQRAQTGLGEVRRADQPVVPCADDDRIEVRRPAGRHEPILQAANGASVT